MAGDTSCGLLSPAYARTWRKVARLRQCNGNEFCASRLRRGSQTVTPHELLFICCRTSQASTKPFRGFDQRGVSEMVSFGFGSHASTHVCVGWFGIRAEDRNTAPSRPAGQLLASPLSHAESSPRKFGFLSRATFRQSLPLSRDVRGSHAVCTIGIAAQHPLLRGSGL